MRRKLIFTLLISFLIASSGIVLAEVRETGKREKEKWVVVTASAGGQNTSAAEKAVNNALRKAVKEACGVFLTSQSKTENYKSIYDKIIADAVGYVVEYETVKTWTDNETDMAYATVKAKVSTRKFKRDWASIAHTVQQENNPRIIVAIVEATRHSPSGPTYEVKKTGIVQTEIEDFLLDKGLTLMDRETREKVSKRDVLLAVVKDDTSAIAAMGAKFDADVVLTGRADAKYSRTLEVSGVKMFQYTASLRIRVVQSDSGRILASKSYGPVTTNTLQRAGGGQKALEKIAEESAPKILTAVVQAWADRANIARDVQLVISNMDYSAWKKFKSQVGKIQGVEAVRLRELTEKTASAAITWKHKIHHLADELEKLKAVNLKITELTANRLKLEVTNVNEKQ